MIMMNAERKIALVNSQTEKLFGYPREELLGQPIEMLVPWRFRVRHPEYVKGFLAAPQPRAMGAGRDLFGLRKDGREVPVEIGLNPLVNKEGVMVLASVIDITERKDNVRRLSELNEDLTQKNHENELFVYAVSHDLRSPLVNLQGFSTELEESCQELRKLLGNPSVPAEVRDASTAILDEGVTQSIRFILSAVSRLGSIIDSLLRLSRVGRVEYRWQTVDVGQVVRRLVDATSSTIEERGATVTVGDLPAAWSDPTAIEQIFGNLIGNALKYLGPDGDGAIEIGALDATSDETNAPMLTYYVKDNGIGIPENCQEKVFQAFQRLESSSVPGEGMGLAIVRRVVGRHNGASGSNPALEKAARSSSRCRHRVRSNRVRTRRPASCQAARRPGRRSVDFETGGTSQSDAALTGTAWIRTLLRSDGTPRAAGGFRPTTPHAPRTARRTLS